MSPNQLLLPAKVESSPASHSEQSQAWLAKYEYPGYVPESLVEFQDLQRRAARLQQEPVSINYEGDVTRAYMTPEGERVPDRVALLMKDKADPKRWVRDAATERVMLEAADKLERAKGVDLFNRNKRKGSQLADRAREMIAADGPAAESRHAHAPLDAATLRNMVGLSRASRHQLEAQGVHVEAFLAQRHRRFGAAPVSRAVYVERVVADTPEKTFLNLAADPRIKTSADVAGMLFSGQIGGSSLYAGAGLGRDGRKVEGRHFSLENLSAAQRAEAKDYTRMLHAVDSLEHRARRSTKRGNNFPDDNTIADALYPPAKVETPEGVRYQTQPMNAERQAVIATIRDRLMKARNEELARPRRFDAVRERIAQLTTKERTAPNIEYFGGSTRDPMSKQEIGLALAKGVAGKLAEGGAKVAEKAADVPRWVWTRMQDVLHGNVSLSDYFRPTDPDGVRRIDSFRVGAAAAAGVLTAFAVVYANAKTGSVPRIPNLPDTQANFGDLTNNVVDSAKRVR